MNFSHLVSIGLPVQTFPACETKAHLSTSTARSLKNGQATPKPEADPKSVSAKVEKKAEAPKQDAKPSGQKTVPNGIADNPRGQTPTETKRVFWENTYVFEHASKLRDVWQDGEKFCVELDQTIFHPQGGGQPSDVGTISAAGLPTLDVVFVGSDKERVGVLRHEVKGDVAAWQSAVGKDVEVMCKIDEEKRRLFARLHSAGHLLDVAVHDVGFCWQAGKSYHFPDAPYVEYIVTKEGRQIEKDQKSKDAAIADLDAKLKELIGKSNSVQISNVDGVRTVLFEDVSVRCGGTHVVNTGELVDVVVRKIAAKKDTIRVSYTIA